jgi:hypothetical protein
MATGQTTLTLQTIPLTVGTGSFLRLQYGSVSADSHNISHYGVLNVIMSTQGTLPFLLLINNNNNNSNNNNNNLFNLSLFTISEALSYHGIAFPFYTYKL